MSRLNWCADNLSRWYISVLHNGPAAQEQQPAAVCALALLQLRPGAGLSAAALHTLTGAAYLHPPWSAACKQQQHNNPSPGNKTGVCQGGHVCSSRLQEWLLHQDAMIIYPCMRPSGGCPHRRGSVLCVIMMLHGLFDGLGACNIAAVAFVSYLSACCWHCCCNTCTRCSCCCFESAGPCCTGPVSAGCATYGCKDFITACRRRRCAAASGASPWNFSAAAADACSSAAGLRSCCSSSPAYAAPPGAAGNTHSQHT